MEAQDATTLLIYKWWPWVEANRNRLIGAAVVLVIAAFVIWYEVCQRQARDVAAGEAVTQVAIAASGPTAQAYLKVAGEYSGTVAGERAQLQGAATLFEAGRFSEAQAQFQKLLDAHPDGQLSGQAALGVATSLDAQGQSDLAAKTYQRVINGYSSDVILVTVAKFDLARIEEAQGRLNDAFVLYQDVANADPSSSFASEAMGRINALRSKLQAASATTPARPAAPANLAP